MQTFFYVLWCFHTIVEALPVSSSGHVELLTCLYTLNTKRRLPTLTEEQNFTMHTTTLAVLIVFLAIIGIPYLLSIPFADFLRLVITVGIADAVTILCYFIVKRIQPTMPMWIGFFITACLLLSLLFEPHGTLMNISYGQALLIGLIQGIALLPGISRLASTYVIARWLGFTHEYAFAFSCLIELPLIAAAVAKSWYLSSSSDYVHFEKFPLLLLLSASVIALGLLLFSFINQQFFIYCGIYMLIVTAVSLWCSRQTVAR